MIGLLCCPIELIWLLCFSLQPPSPSPALSGSSTTAPTPSGYASDDDDDDLIGHDDDSLDGEGGGGGIDDADDEDRIPEELLLKYANEAGLEKGTVSVARVLLKLGYPRVIRGLRLSILSFVLSNFCAFVLLSYKVRTYERND